MDVWESLLRMVSPLAVVMDLMLACAYLFRRLQGTKVFTAGTAPLVKVLGSGYLGSRKSIVLVNVAGEVLIVGTTADGLVPLGRLNNRQLQSEAWDPEMKVEAKVEVEHNDKSAT